MKALTLFLPLSIALFLGLFSLSLPDLRSCRLPASGERSGRASPRERLCLLLLTLLYAACAFFRLGGNSAPQSFVSMAGEELVLSLPEDAAVSGVMLYCGVGQGEYELYGSTDYVRWDKAADFKQGHVEVLKWHRLSPEWAERPRYVWLRCVGGLPWLGELVLLDGDGVPIPVESSQPLLTDEQDTVPVRQLLENSSYFDEIYHARTAWEHLNGVSPYEISHPPLGKELIALGVAVFGMTPFGWRFTGTLFGVLMLPLLHVFLRRLFGDWRLALLGTAVFAADFMHYVQTRIATIDVYAVFFILLMYLFLWIWLEEDRLSALALCGFCFGLGAASKWTCLYAGAGLAVLWAGHWLRLALAPPREGEAPIFPRFVKNALFCLLFFVLVPALIYCLSYLPYAAPAGVRPFSGAYFRLVWDNQLYMFRYHSGINATHPYSSRWYQWLVDLRPILYYLDTAADGRRASIAAFVNPLLCWGGLLSLFATGFCAAVRRDRRGALILVGYLAELLPWVFIRRLTFAYHYFPSTLFLVLSLGYVFALLKENRRDWLRWVLAFAALSLLLFLLFFPVLNGLYVNSGRAGAWLKWLPTWPL